MADRWYLATIRHGETDFNKQNRYAGTIDVPLNDAGREDARQACGQIEGMNFELCLSSPFKRAVETAQVLTAGKLDVIPCDHARERHFGVLQGRTIADVESVRPPIHFIKVGSDYHSVDIPEGETFPALRNRAVRFHRHLLDNYLGRRVLIVSHGVFLQQFHGLLRGQDWIEALGFHVGNLELTIFQLEGEMVVSEERRHLTGRERIDF
ncbi:MAG: histidine phosphatase family protein [Methanomassiliicoccus sp.]|nr:histidine phosphatase family protein [Methanomassiliicoccus sp.]